MTWLILFYCYGVVITAITMQVIGHTNGDNIDKYSIVACFLWGLLWPVLLSVALFRRVLS